MLKHWKHLLIGVIAVGLLVTPFAVATGEGDPILGGVRNPEVDQTKELTRETEIIANVNTYGTRQSNKSNNGGGAIYGCRSAQGGTPAGNEPCIRANNLSTGYAFEFESDGNVVGRIDAVGNGGDNTKPFTTNATGVADGLNADRVDGKNAEEIRNEAVAVARATEPYAQVASDGTLGSNRGVTGASRQGDGDYDVVFSGDVTGCGVNATVNGTDGGEISFALAASADKSTTTADVRTFESAGVPADRAFHIVANC